MLLHSDFNLNIPDLFPVADLRPEESYSAPLFAAFKTGIHYLQSATSWRVRANNIDN